MLDAFDVVGEVYDLPGGQGTSVGAGGLVLKPGADQAETEWLGTLADRLVPDGFRLALPVATADGRYVVSGWSATARLEGSPVADHDASMASWLRVLEAGRAFHRALRAEPVPSFLAGRTHRWAAGDRVAWGESAPSLPERSAAILAPLRAMVVDEGLADQLVHGDLSGNVLLVDGPPGIIDVSPYWRPAAYADAIVVVDALLWWRAGAVLLEAGRPTGLGREVWRSLLARALVFRLVAFDEANQPDQSVVADELARYAQLAGLLAPCARTDPAGRRPAKT